MSRAAELNRRHFLACCSAMGLGSTLLPEALTIAAQDAGRVTLDVLEAAQKIAGLARLSLTEAELTRFAGQLTAILGYFQKLAEVETAGVAPASHPPELRSPLRRDEAAPFAAPDQLVALSRGAAGELFRVPRVVE